MKRIVRKIRAHNKTAKDIIRRHILIMRSAQKGDVKLPKDDVIKKRLLSLPEFSESKIILFYVSVRGEVKTDSIISEALAHGKRILVPFADVETRQLFISEIKNLNDLSPGAFGIPEPKHHENFPLDKVDLVIVPGIAFDRHGDRVGYGTGFYDRFLKKFRNDTPFIGLAYDFQIVGDIPENKMDVRVHKIVTEKGIINCAKN